VSSSSSAFRSSSSSPHLHSPPFRCIPSQTLQLPFSPHTTTCHHLPVCI
jgi:hypothetical protein